MSRLVITGLVVLCAIAGCGTQSSSTTGALRAVPKTDRIDKFFIVLVGDKTDGSGGCTVDVQPKDNGTADWVKIEKNWRVAWFVVNTCSAAKGVVPTIEFALKSDSTKKKTPINFSVQNADVLIGKVKQVGGDCKDTTTEAPCTTFKYKVSLGIYNEDPDVEIIVY